MKRRLPGIGVFGLALGVIGLMAATASGAGGPVTPSIHAAGVSTPDGRIRFIDRQEGRRTVVTRAKGGYPDGSASIPGRFKIPAVSFDGSASGLSADGGTLVLRQARYPRRHTSFAIVDAQELRLRRVITLPGFFTFDAISPDGSRLFFIEYPSPRNAIRYAVREYDVDAARLLPNPIVDPSERGEQMRGNPITRAVSRDGRWAYTLYDGGGKSPFIHALDTVAGEAHCIDDIDALARLSGRDLFNLHLTVSGGGGQLTIADRDERPVALVDTRTFEATEPAPQAPAAQGRPAGNDSGAPWSLIMPAAAVFLLAGTALTRILRHRRDDLAAGGT